MRASRLLSILTTLQAKGHVTAQALAAECEVSLRTIYRDVDALSAAGIPIYSVQGSSGGYRLLDGYRVRLNGLSSTETEALFLAGLTRQAADLGMGAVVASARAKLLAALPEAMRPGAMKTRFHFDAPAWFAEPETLDHLPAIADAVWNQHPIRMRYQSRTTDKERQVEPLGIVLKGGAWYLVAQVHNEVRTFRVSRISKMMVLDDRFEYPKAFDLEGYWAESIRRYEVDLHPNRAEIRLSPWGIDMMEELLPPYVRNGAVISEEADARGWRQVSVSVGSMAHAAMEILRFGKDVEVIGPPDLRTEMANVVGALAKFYNLNGK
ncbi:transcriptional regulator [Mesorhizobium sp. Root552]|jgi:predicted DNA-binding transcriptional regulator YafY|uniref:helix-turn-helix transcriptional regulator n=1 Tax=Mesorhizobium sp. Root552 TaxID=1736555 RepID=UPI0006F579FC|nr:YafY family protein [Mesorhizobium sp. Root552]KQZ30772.1 transcriptional regulator [Mesorhizobium sp. Root552]